MTLGELWKRIIQGNAGLSERDFIQREIQAFLQSKKYKMMITGREYYEGKQDILKKVRYVLDERGNRQPMIHAPNNRIVNNRFDDLVDQKASYLLAKPLEVKGIEGLEDIFDAKWQRRLKYVCMDSLLGGIGYMYPYIDADGTLAFKRLRPEQVIPFWADEEHEELDAFIYMYDVEIYNANGSKETIKKVEFYKPDGVSYYIYQGYSLKQDTEKEKQSYLTINGKAYNWARVPLIVFKANASEQPLIARVKTLQDALNMLISNYADCMEEDIRSTILVIKNYDGTDMSTFRQNLARYGAIKVKDVDDMHGGVDALRIEVNSSNYELLIKLLKDAIIENGRGFDAKDDRMSNNPNQMNIHSMYSDIELDANSMELEFQAALLTMMEFVNAYTGIKGRTIENDVTFIFNRDLPMNEADVINNCRNSVGLLSTETIIANHPWTQDTEEELAKLKAEQAEMMAVDYAQGGSDE